MIKHFIFENWAFIVLCVILVGTTVLIGESIQKLNKDKTTIFKTAYNFCIRENPQITILTLNQTQKETCMELLDLAERNELNYKYLENGKIKTELLNRKIYNKTN